LSKQKLNKIKFKGKRRFYAVITIVVAIILADTFLFFENRFEGKGEEKSEEREARKVVYVYDGDTVKLESGQVVRYIGIDAPEEGYYNHAKECYNKEATARNEELVLGKEVILVKDISETDKYGRLLRYVYIGDTFVNETLVREGFARASNYPPDERYKDRFKEAEEEAKNNKRGLWADGVCE
jgi:micrococcal nuclease